jgi:hypothetical protein
VGSTPTSSSLVFGKVITLSQSDIWATCFEPAEE